MGWRDLFKPFALTDSTAVQYTHLRDEEGEGIEMTTPQVTDAVQ